MNRVDFERFLTEELLCQLTPGSVLVLDNVSIHKGGKILEIVENAGCRLLCLPPYSPDFNPIELAWAYVKRLIRRIGPREDAHSEQALRDALVAIPDTLAGSCYRH